MSEQQSKLGLVLGGGGAKATIYLGFYEILYKNAISIDYIAGTSMGAIIGAAIALGWTPEDLQAYFLKNSDFNLASLSNFNFFNESIFKRDDFDKILYGICGDKTFADTKIPFACTAVDLEQKSEFTLNEGPLMPALQATSAYPPMLAPIFYQEKYLVDGGIIDNVPGLLARSMEQGELENGKLVAFRLNNNIVRQYIAGHVFMRHYNAPKKTLGFNIFKRKIEDIKFISDIMLESISIASGRNVDENLAKAKPEILIEPTVNISLADFSQTEEIIEQGRKLGEEYLPQIKAILGMST